MAEHDKAIRALAVCVFISMLGLGIISPILPLYAKSLGATYAIIGLLSSAWSISRFVFTIPVGQVSDTWSKKKIISLGISVYVTVSMLYVLAWDSTTLLVIRILHGLGSAMTMPIALAYTAGLAPEGQEGKYMGTMTLAMFAGMGVGPLIGGTLTDLFSLTFPFYVMGALTSISLLITLVFLPEEARPVGDKPRTSYRKVLRNPMLRAVFVYRVVAALGMGTIMGFLSIYISGSADMGGLGLSVSRAGLVITLGQVTSALLQRPFGELADRYNKVRLALLGGFVSSVGFTLFMFSNDFWSVLAAQLVFSVGGAIGMPALSAIVAIEGRGVGVGIAMSVLESAFSLGTILGPLTSGFIVDAFGLTPLFMLWGAVTLAGMAIFYVLVRLIPHRGGDPKLSPGVS